MFFQDVKDNMFSDVWQQLQEQCKPRSSTNQPPMVNQYQNNRYNNNRSNHSYRDQQNQNRQSKQKRQRNQPMQEQQFYQPTGRSQQNQRTMEQHSYGSMVFERSDLKKSRSHDQIEDISLDVAAMALPTQVKTNWHFNGSNQSSGQKGGSIDTKTLFEMVGNKAVTMTTDSGKNIFVSLLYYSCLIFCAWLIVMTASIYSSV